MATFLAGDTVWTMNNTMLLRTGYERLLLSINLSEKPVNIIKSFPYKANATVGEYYTLLSDYIYFIYNLYIIETLQPVINLTDYVPQKVIAEHSSVMLMCFAYGRSKISYYWEQQNKNTGNWTAASVERDIGLLILSSVTDDNEGTYRCVACDCYSCSYSLNTTTMIVYGKK